MPALIENYVHVLNVDGAEYELALWDTVSQQEFERWRSSRHPDTDVVLIHFEINDPDSFDNVSDKASFEFESLKFADCIYIVGNGNSSLFAGGTLRACWI